MTAKTRSSFKTDQAATFADNTSGAITAADLRAEIVNLADSAAFPEDLRTANLATLAAIPEASCVDGDMRMVTDIGVIYRYDADGVSGGAAVVPTDDSDAQGVWIPTLVQIVNLSSPYHSGTLSVDYVGGDSAAGDPTKFLNETGAFTTPTGSITTAAADPASAPGSAGVISVNTVDRRPWIAFGTSGVGDWVRLVTFEDMELPADLPTATITTADLLTFGDDSDAGLSKATTVANFLADLGLATLTGTQTLTNKTLTDPKITLAVNAQTGTTYTLVLSDAHKKVTMDNASANTLTIPTNASVAFPVGTIIGIAMIGAGTTTVDGDTGVTVNGVSGGGATILARYSGVTLTKIGTDAWLMEGNHGTVA